MSSSGSRAPIGQEVEKCEEYRRRKIGTLLGQLGRESIFGQTSLGMAQTLGLSAVSVVSALSAKRRTER